MRRIFTLILAVYSISAWGQTTDYTVRINAKVQQSPASIMLNWVTTTGAGGVNIYRKAKNATSWGAAIATLPSTATTYKDNNVAAGQGYEYMITKNDPTAPYGYIYAGIEEPAIHNRGAILLLVDATFKDSLKAEIATLMEDMRGDGWEVEKKEILRTATVADVKSQIKSAYQANQRLTALYILGHIAVPYSGEINPDGHNNHIGAWPADAYYGELNGTWTDNGINNTSSANSKNHNIPGDGKFDQSVLPSELELQVGRVDVYDMPAFGKTEITLMRSYLNKAHQYKAGALTVIKRALIDDNFKTGYTEAFAGNGWRNFSVMVSIDSVSEKNLISTLNTDFYQWAYGCGGGTYISAGGIGNTTNFASGPVKSIFTPLFGSYFGDWNYTNSFLRAPLCSEEPSLACFWAGRPNWHLHHMALGEHIGYSTRLTQNNTNLYKTPITQFGRFIHIALMGDPTLRTDYIKGATSVSVSNDPKSGATITWTASPEPGLAGYYVYRSDSEFGEYKLRSDMIAGTSFTDSFGKNGDYWYMVRPVKLTQTPSGSYYNMGIGVSFEKKGIVYPYPELNVKTITGLNDISVFPNPAGNTLNLSVATKKSSDAVVTITDMQGRTLISQEISLLPGINTQGFNVSQLAQGVYILNINAGTEKHALRWIKMDR